MVSIAHPAALHACCTPSLCEAAASFAFCSSRFLLVCAPVNGMESNVVPEMKAALKMRACFMFSGGSASGPARRVFTTGAAQERSGVHEGWSRGRKGRTNHQYDARGVLSTQKDGRARLCVVRDFDPEIETDREEDKGDGRDRHKDDVDSGEVVGFHYARSLLFSNHLNREAGSLTHQRR